MLFVIVHCVQLHGDEVHVIVPETHVNHIWKTKVKKTPGIRSGISGKRK